MNVYIIGNILVKEDSLPIRYLPGLRKIFPDIAFEEVDPTENFIPEEGSVIIDTVQGITNVTLFHSLDVFEKTTRISPHEYDLLLHLQLLKKLHKISRVTIIGVPQSESNGTEDQLHLILRKCVAQLMQGS